MSTQAQNGPVTKKDISELRSALRSEVLEVLTEGRHICVVALTVSNNFQLLLVSAIGWLYIHKTRPFHLKTTG